MQVQHGDSSTGSFCSSEGPLFASKEITYLYTKVVTSISFFFLFKHYAGHAGRGAAMDNGNKAGSLDDGRVALPTVSTFKSNRRNGTSY